MKKWWQLKTTNKHIEFIVAFLAVNTCFWSRNELTRSHYWHWRQWPEQATTGRLRSCSHAAALLGYRVCIWMSWSYLSIYKCCLYKYSFPFSCSLLNGSPLRAMKDLPFLMQPRLEPAASGWLSYRLFKHAVSFHNFVAVVLPQHITLIVHNCK